MDLTCKVPIFLTAEAEMKLWKVSHLCTELWNGLVTQRKNYHLYGKTNKYEQKKCLPQVKKEMPEFKIPASQVLQEVVFDCDRSYQMFFTKIKMGDKDVRPPKFKSRKYFYTQTYNQQGTNFFIEGNKIKLAYGKGKKEWIEVVANNLKIESVKIVKIKFDKISKKWYALLTYKVDEKPKMKEGHRLYFDPGCKTALTGLKTNGKFFEYSFNPLRKLNMATYKYIDELKSKRDLIKNKKSKAWKRLNKRIKKLFRKITTRTKQYLHSLANRILEDHKDVSQFKIGDWDKRKTLADTKYKIVNRSINRAVQNNNPLGILFEILSYKSKLNGQEVAKFDERGSTRTCSMCDHIHKEGISPSVRNFKCQNCNFHFPRDFQSTLNFIKKYESAVWRGLSGTLPDSSQKIELAPFSGKPQLSAAHVTALETS